MGNYIDGVIERVDAMLHVKSGGVPTSVQSSVSCRAIQKKNHGFIWCFQYFIDLYISYSRASPT